MTLHEAPRPERVLKSRGQPEQPSIFFNRAARTTLSIDVRRSSPVQAGEPQYVQKVADFFEANLARRIRMAQLASLTGVSVRSIQVAFRRHRGCSPLAFLRAQRLARARALLLCGAPASVTDVALACGFEHLGRFSAVYRACFGERPIETLDRSTLERPVPSRRARVRAVR